MRRWIRWVVLLASSSLFAETAAEYEKLNPGEKAVAEATVFYSEPFLFDYDKDGVKNSVAMGAKLFVKKTAEGYRGYLIRGLYDIELNRPVAFYETTLNMHPPENIAIGDIVVQGRTVRFKSGPYTYVFKDGGEGLVQDEVVVKLGKKSKKLRLYGGDIEIFSKM